MPRFGVIAALLAVALGFTGDGPEPAEAAPAVPQPLSGLVVVTSYSAYDSQSPKTATASCPAGKVVLGGGVFVSYDRRVTVTQLQPYRPGQNSADPLGQGYWVSAAETAPGNPDNWWVRASAICAYPVPGHHIVSHATGWSSSSWQETDAVCPSGERILGTGARIVPFNVGGQYQHGIGLQVARADVSGVLTRAGAREQPGGYGHNWQLVAYAVCGQAPTGYGVFSAASQPGFSEPYRQVNRSCPYWVNPYTNQTIRRRPISVGASVGNAAPANVTLNQAYPFNGQAWADAAENTPTPLRCV